MIDDSERREVACLARALAEHEFDFECDSVAKAIGANRNFPAQAWGRLADLIEPQTSEQTNHDESSPSASPIDRDALLELADEMDGAYPDSRDVAVEYIDDYARRIREACGEVER